MGDWGKITNPKDLDMLVRVALTESNGTDAGIRDVASVIFNRASATNKSIAQIVTAKNQFEAVTNGRAARVSRASKEYQNTLNALKPLLTGQIGDTTGGATLFVSPKGQSALGRNMPKWAIPSRMTKEANGHQFYQGAFPGSVGDGNLNEVNQYVSGFIQRSQKQTDEIRNKINQTFDDAEKQAQAATTDNVTLYLRKQYYDYRSGKMTPEQEAEYERNVNVGNIMLAPNQSLKRQIINAPPLPIEVINKYNSHEGDDGNYRQNVEYMVKSGEFSIPKGYELKIPPKRTAGETLAMQTGQIALGAAGAADIIANPVKEFANPIIQAVGGTPIAQNPTQTGTQQLLDMAGIAKPQTSVEQLAAGAGRGLGSVLPFMGAGAVAKGAGGVAGAVGEGLTATPMADLVGGATSGLAAEGTRQAGGNEVAQFAAGLVGGIGGFGLAKAAENTIAKIGAKQGQSIAQIISEKPPTKPLVDGAGQLTDDGVEFGIEHGLKADEVKAALIPEMPTQKAPISEAAPEAMPEVENVYTPTKQATVKYKLSQNLLSQNIREQSRILFDKLKQTRNEFYQKYGNNKTFSAPKWDNDPLAQAARKAEDEYNKFDYSGKLKRGITASKAYLKDISNEDYIKNFHKNENLNFVSDTIPDEAYRFYKSPSYNKRQSSEYWLANVNGELRLYRKSDHWGRFYTNIYAKNDAEFLESADPFGRIGSKAHEWNLTGQSSKSKSQSGYIIVGDIAEDGSVSFKNINKTQANMAGIKEPIPEAISEAMPEAQLSKQAETIPTTAATRLSEAQSLDVPLTKGQATQSFDVQDAENTLRASQGAEGQQARNFDINQAQKIEQAKNNLLQSIGDMNETPEIRGQKIKDQLRVLKDEGAAGVKAAYQAADEAAKKLGGDAIKLNTDNIKETYKQISVDEFVEPQIKKSIQQEMARYGLVGKAEPINENGITKVIFDDGSSMNIYGEIKPLTLSNADNFAKQMNSLYLQDKSYASQAMKRAVNDSLYGALENGKFPELATAKQEFGKFKGNFEAKDIVQKLIDYRKGTSTDIVLPERTIPSILGNGAGSVSNLKRIKSILLSSKSEESKAAWNAIQVQGLSDIFEGAYQVNTNLGAGATPTISGAKLNTNISKFGTDKLKILFDEKQFNEIMKLRRVISNATIPVKGTVNTSGTAYKLVNMIATRVPIIGKYVDTAQTLLGHANEWLQAKKTLENMTNFNESKALQEPLAPQSSKVQELINRADEAANAMLQELFKVSPTLVAPIINAPQKPQE